MGVSDIKVWPISHLAWMISMRPSSKAKASYKVKPYHSSLTDYANAVAKMIPICSIAFFFNYLYPIETQIKEAKEFEMVWIAKLAARDLFACLSLPLIWHALVYNSSITSTLR